MRDKLIELTKSSLIRHIDKSCKLAENIADDLLAEGVIVPPCKVGQIVYVIDIKRPCHACWACTDFCHRDCRFDDKGKMVVKRATVFEISVNNVASRIRVEIEGAKGVNSYNHTYWFQDFGKTIFLAKKPAEQALAEVAQ